jgi:hypothetical protein
MKLPLCYLALFACGAGLAFAEQADERVERWKNKVEQFYRTPRVTWPFWEREYEKVVRLLPETAELLEAGKAYPEIADLVLEAIAEAVAEPEWKKRNAGSPSFPYLFCELKGLRARVLIEATRIHEGALPELILALFSDHPLDLKEILESAPFKRSKDTPVSPGSGFIPVGPLPPSVRRNENP